MAAAEEGHPPDRGAFLAQHAEVAGALNECLDGLAALRAVRSSPKQASTGTQSSGPVAEGAPGMALGDFRIVREIGRGGMGVVYEAEQLSLGRRVALKVLPFAAALDARQLQRFKNEAQAAAHLHHPHIVPVHFVGVERGVHYYAMQLIEGQDLADLISRLGAEKAAGRGGIPATVAGADANLDDRFSCADQEDAAPAALTGAVAQLSTQRASRSGDYYRTVVAFVRQAAEALEYGHAMGVVHRDIKPANLLVDNHGNLWVTDFGLAQFADTGLTQTGELLGTLRYMSPEQAGGQRVLLDHRTDVYSLGATLYELLTLKPIFDAADRQALLRRIINDEPRSPRSLDRSIPPELETIVLKAVSKLPGDRYATAREFAEDLQRFLFDEPIKARRPTLVQRGRKWLRRHPSAPITGVVLLLLLTVGSLVSAWLIGREKDNTQRAYLQLQQEEAKVKRAYVQLLLEQEKVRRAYEREQQRAEEAEKRFRIAQTSANELIEVSEQELIDNPFMVGLRKRLLESALGYYQELVAQRRDDPTAQKELEATGKRIQQILNDLAVLERSNRVDILKKPDVQKDLGLTQEQRGRLDELLRRIDDQAREQLREFDGLAARERRQRFLDVARAKDDAVMQVLTTQQFRRYEQLVLQAQGLAAFFDPHVIAALKLTPRQRERLRAIVSEARPPGQNARPAPGGPGKPPSHDPRSPEEKFHAELTEEQARRWKELTGEPFKGSLRPTPPPRQPGPPGKQPGRPSKPG
jgi:serine/threonine protein kinase